MAETTPSLTYSTESWSSKPSILVAASCTVLALGCAILIVYILHRCIWWRKQKHHDHQGIQSSKNKKHSVVDGISAIATSPLNALLAHPSSHTPSNNSAGMLFNKRLSTQSTLSFQSSILPREAQIRELLMMGRQKRPDLVAVLLHEQKKQQDSSSKKKKQAAEQTLSMPLGGRKASAPMSLFFGRTKSLATEDDRNEVAETAATIYARKHSRPAEHSPSLREVSESDCQSGSRRASRKASLTADGVSDVPIQLLYANSTSPLQTPQPQQRPSRPPQAVPTPPVAAIHVLSHMELNDSRTGDFIV